MEKGALDRETFVKAWDNLCSYRIKSDTLFRQYGIDVSKLCSDLYENTILFLRQHLTPTQVDFFVWSIYDQEPVISFEDGTTEWVDTAEKCLNYIYELETEKTENEKTDENG
jgi:hypothetical protein